MTFFSSIFGVKAQQDNAITVLEASVFKDSITNNKVQLIDVRTSDEFKSGHIKGAKNIDFFSANFISEFSKLDKEKPVYIYCRSGSRSRQSANKLIAMGFKEIYDLRGGFMAW